MAFAITNFSKPHPDATGLPVAHQEVADTTTVASVDMGVAGLKHLRGRIWVKSYGADNTQVTFVVKVSTVAGMTTPETVHQSPTLIATLSTATGLNHDFQGWSQAGFRYVSVVPTTATGTCTFDMILDAE